MMTEWDTDELKGAQLDFAVAKALGYEHVVISGTECHVFIDGVGEREFSPRKNPIQAWPIIDKYRISMENVNDWRGDDEEWRAYQDAGDDESEYEQLGETALVAAMRTFVHLSHGPRFEMDMD